MRRALATLLLVTLVACGNPKATGTVTTAPDTALITKCNAITARADAIVAEMDKLTEKIDAAGGMLANPDLAAHWNALGTEHDKVLDQWRAAGCEMTG